MSTLQAWGVALGALAGLGIWSMVMSMPTFRAPSLQTRVAHLVADISPQAYADVTADSSAPLPALGSGRNTLRRALQTAAEQVGGSPDVLQRDLARAGSVLTISEFRSRQVTAFIWGGAVGLVVDGVVGFLVQPVALAYIVVPEMFACVGFLGMRYLLTRTAKARVLRIEAQLPAVWEFLSLSLSAGEGLPDSLRRMAQIGQGDISDEFRSLVLEVDLGVPLATALTSLSTRLRIPALSRGIEQILGALHRGTPVSTVLQAHAVDAREDSKRRLLESAGQKEVTMLVPLVFLILPVTIVFAVFPGLIAIQTGL